MLHSGASLDMLCALLFRQNSSLTACSPGRCTALSPCCTASGQVQHVTAMQLPKRACSPLQDPSQAAQTPSACAPGVPVPALPMNLHCARACCLHSGDCLCVGTEKQAPLCRQHLLRRSRAYQSLLRQHGLHASAVCPLQTPGQAAWSPPAPAQWRPACALGWSPQSCAMSPWTGSCTWSTATTSSQTLHTSTVRPSAR